MVGGEDAKVLLEVVLRDHFLVRFQLREGRVSLGSREGVQTSIGDIEDVSDPEKNRYFYVSARNHLWLIM